MTEYALEICALAFLGSVIAVRILESSRWAMSLQKSLQFALALSVGLVGLVVVLFVTGETVAAMVCSAVIALLLMWVALSRMWDSENE